MSTFRPMRFLAAIAASTCAAFAAAGAQQVVVLKDGVAALALSSPDPNDLSSGATLNLNLPSASMNATATASVGQSGGGFWHKDTARLQAQVKGPLGSSFSASGGQLLSFDYRSPTGTSGPAAADHLVRSENQTAEANLTVPVAGAELVAGTEHASALSQDVSGAKNLSPQVGTEGHSLFARVEWRPLPLVGIEASAAARTADVTWRDGTSRSSSYRSVDPKLSVSLAPWQGAEVSTKLEHAVAPYDTAAFASYSADQASGAPALQPNHAWQLEARFEQAYGDAKFSASYTASRQGSTTELAPAEKDMQAPVSTPLLRRDSVAVTVAVPLDRVGLSGTDLTSQAQWQTSRVTDPVTGLVRAASGEVPRKYSLRLSHALPGVNLKLGLTGDFTGARTAYQVDQIDATSAGGSLGAFLAFTPGPYQLDLNLSGMCGASTTDYIFRGSRQGGMPDHVALQPGGGPMLSLSLHKPL